MVPNAQAEELNEEGKPLKHTARCMPVTLLGGGDTARNTEKVRALTQHVL